MNATLTQERDAVVLKFDEAFDIRDAIGLRELIQAIPARMKVVLDFRAVRWLRKATAAAALIPSLGTARGHRIQALGLETLALS